MTAWKSLVPSLQVVRAQGAGHAEVQDAEPSLTQVHDVGRMWIGVHEAVIQHLLEPALGDGLSEVAPFLRRQGGDFGGIQGVTVYAFHREKPARAVRPVDAWNHHLCRCP